MAKSQKEFEQAVYELENYFDSNADSRFGIYIGRKLTDNDYIEFVDDVCKKYNVDFVPRKNDEFTYQVINKKSLKLNESFNYTDFIDLFLDTFSVIFLFSQRKNIKKALGYKENESIIKTLIMNIKKALDDMNDDSNIN